MKYIHRAFYYLLLLLLPVQLGRHFWPAFSFVNGIRIDYLSPTLYLTDIILLALLIPWAIPYYNHIRDYLSKKRSYTFFSIAGVALLVLVLVRTPTPLLSLYKVLTLGKLLALYLYIRHTTPSIRYSGYALTCSLAYSCLLAWGQFVSQASLGGIVWWLGERTFSVTTPGIATTAIQTELVLRPYATFPHPNVLGGYLVVLLPFMAYTLYQKHIASTIRIPLLLLTTATLLITFSRSAWLAGSITVCLGSMIVLWGLQKKKVRFVREGLLTVALAIVLLLTQLPVLSERIMSLATYNTEPVTQRIFLNELGKTMIRNHPLLGVGPHQFIPTVPSLATIYTYQDIQPAHNTYILIAAELGVLGLGMVLFTIGNHLRILLTKNSRTPYKAACVLSIGSIVLLSFFDHYFYTIHQTQLLVAVVLGLSATARNRTI